MIKQKDLHFHRIYLVELINRYGGNECACIFYLKPTLDITPEKKIIKKTEKRKQTERIGKRRR